MKKSVKVFLHAIVFTVIFSAQAFALDVAGLKAQGLIGERPNGLVGKVIPSVTPAVDEAIQKINAERLARYRDVAARNTLPLDKVQSLAGEKLINQTERGQFIQTPSGAWVQK